MERDKSQIFSLLGLCMRSGKLVSGEFKTKKAVQERKASLVLISEDASEGTKKLFGDKCGFYKIPLYHIGNRQELGHSIGKTERCSVAVLDEGFAKSLINKLDNTAVNGGGSKYGKSEGL